MLLKPRETWTNSIQICEMNALSNECGQQGNSAFARAERMRMMIQKRTQGYKVCAPTATNRSTIRYRQPVQVDGTMKSRERVGTGEDRHYGPIDLKTWYDGNDREKERLWRLYSTTYAMRHAA